ncbi:MAG: hypothetical protein AAGI54_03220 [Planctomycetota bacterium]
MSAWSKITEGSWLSYALIGIATVAVAYLVYTQAASGGPRFKQVYYYNLETQSLVSLPADSIPPVVMGDGTTAVRAYVYDCSNCGDENGVFVAFLERYTDDARAVRSKYPLGTTIPTDEAGPLMRGNYMLVATPEMALAGEWVSRDSQRGGQITALGLSCPITDESLVPINP